MNKTLTSFIGNVKNGLAKNTHYDVFFSTPRVVSSSLYDYATLEKIMMFCEQTQLPGMNMATTAIRTYGEVREMPYEKMFEPVTMTFYVDKEMKVKLFFDEWLSNIQNPFTRTFAYYEDYISNIDVIVYDTQLNSRYKVSMYEAYPKSISAIQMDYNNKDVMRIQVTFQYKYWRTTMMTSPYGDKAALAPGQTPAALQSLLTSGVSIPNSYWNNYTKFQNNVNSVTNSINRAQNTANAIQSIWG